MKGMIQTYETSQADFIILHLLWATSLLTFKKFQSEDSLNSTFPLSLSLSLSLSYFSDVKSFYASVKARFIE